VTQRYKKKLTPTGDAENTGEKKMAKAMNFIRDTVKERKKKKGTKVAGISTMI